MNMIELFCGSGTISKEFEKFGYNTFSVDVRRRVGVCDPDLRKDILDVRLSDIPFHQVNFLWASPPCDVFSKASGGIHWNKDGTPKTEKCQAHIKILHKTLKLIEKINPDIFFIENPDAKMKYDKEMIKFLIRNNARIIRINLQAYGFPTKKPTLLFTNALDFVPGTFSNNNLQDTFNSNKVIFDNLTKCQKQKSPEALAKELVLYMIEKETKKNKLIKCNSMNEVIEKSNSNKNKVLLLDERLD
jgi:hypothetical protein